MKQALAQALAERPEGEEALVTVREFMVSRVAAGKSKLDEQIGRCIHDDDTLRSHLRARLAQLEEVIAPAIARDLGAPEADFRPQLVAASLTAAFNLLSERGRTLRTAEDVAAQIDPVIAFLRGGLAALKEPAKDRSTGPTPL